SRYHARISLIDGRYMIHDVEAANRTVLNDQLLARPEALGDGDLIIIGRVLFQVAADPPPKAAPRPTPGPRSASSRGSARRRATPPPATEPGRARQPDRDDRPNLSSARVTRAKERPAEPAPQTDLASLREVAQRLASSGERLDRVATALGGGLAGARAERDRLAAVRDRFEEILDLHATAGGDAELHRLIGLLHAPLANQTDFAALWALGRDAKALGEAARLARRSLSFCRELAAQD
ncbi:MAG: FHA domain-containing protein, partial [Chloroflexi bacterium]|nr:FHA domain-containing protein [Chloroflexota bacterium]